MNKKGMSHQKRSKYLPQIKDTTLKVNDFVEIAMRGDYRVAYYGKILSIVDKTPGISNETDRYMVLINTYYSQIEQIIFPPFKSDYTFYICRQVINPKIIKDIKFNYCLDRDDSQFKIWGLDHLIFDNFSKEAGDD